MRLRRRCKSTVHVTYTIDFQRKIAIHLPERSLYLLHASALSAAKLAVYFRSVLVCHVYPRIFEFLAR